MFPTFIFEETAEYARVARDAYATVLAGRAGAAKHDVLNVPSDQQATAFQERLRHLEAANRQAFVTIVFAAMALESFINTIAIESLSKSYFTDYLERLELASKWVVVPDLTKKCRLARDGSAFRRLRKLVKDRNQLVHGKASLVKSFAEMQQFGDKSRNYQEAADNAIAALDEVSDEVGDRGRKLRSLAA